MGIAENDQFTVWARILSKDVTYTRIYWNVRLFVDSFFLLP